MRDYLDALDPDDVVVFASTQEPPEDYDASVAYKVIRYQQYAGHLEPCSRS